MMKWPVYPILIGIFPVLASFVQNQFELDWSDLVRPVLICSVVAATAYSLSYVVSKQRDTAGVISLIILGMLFTYPFALVKSVIPIMRQRYFMPLWFGCCIAACLLVARMLRHRQGVEKATPFLNCFALILCGMQCVQGITNATNHTPAEAKVHQPLPAESDAASTPALANTVPSIKSTRPDIYMLVPDAYARQDVLSTRFAFDNGQFIQELRDAGFVVADKSHSNYCWTHLSLSSTLNLDYLQELLPADFEAAAPRGQRERVQYLVGQLGRDYIQSNRLRSTLESLGYQWRWRGSGYAVTRQVDRSFNRLILGQMSQFEKLLLSTTFLGPTTDYLAALKPGSSSMKGEWIKGNLTEFAAPPDGAKPTFTFCHIVSPHTPFCFDETGGNIPRNLTFRGSLEHRQQLPGYLEYYRENYPRNVAGLNTHLKHCIQTLLDRTNREAIIVVLADHGSSLGLYEHNLSKTDVFERFGVLNAVYLPKQYSREGLRESLSSVNTFRVILSNVFGFNLPQLEDVAWFSSGDLKFTDVTSKMTP